MTLKDKNGAVQKMAFSATLKNSSTEKAWNNHEERLAQHFQSILDLDNDFKEIKQKEASAFSPMTDLGKACLKCIGASHNYNNQYPFGLPMLKNKYKEERKKVKKEMDNEIAQKFGKWCQMFFPLRGMTRLPEVLIRERFYELLQIVRSMVFQKGWNTSRKSKHWQSDERGSSNH